jgi:DNA-binding response OmpR family regulator
MKKKILIFDDDESIVDVLTIILVEAGYKVISATEGKEALAITEREKPDLILLDILMSGMDGKEFKQSLKEIEGTDEIPIIVISANTKTKEIAKEIGATDFIYKPFEIDEVLEKIESIID